MNRNIAYKKTRYVSDGGFGYRYFLCGLPILEIPKSYSAIAALEKLDFVR